MIKIKKYIFVKQDDLKDCGVSSLLMIIRTYKGNCSKEYLRWITNTTKEGTTAYDLIKASERFNFNAYGCKTKIENIGNEKLPIIAHTIIKNTYKHFIVIYEIDHNKQTVLVADPASKIKTMTFDEFKEISTNTFIFFKPNKKILSLKSNNSLIKLIYKFIASNKSNVFLSVILSLIFAIFTCCSSYYLKFLLDNYNLFFKFDLIFFIIVSFCLVTILTSLINYIKNMLLMKFNNKLDFLIFKNVYNKIISLPYIYFKNRTTGEVLSRFNDLSIVKDMFTTFITSIIIDILLLITSIIFLSFIDKIFILLSLLIIVIFILMFIHYKDKYNNNINLVKEKEADVNTYFINTVEGIETIRNLNIKNIFNNKFDLIFNNFIDNYKIHNKLILKSSFIFELINNFTLIIIIIISIYLVDINKINISSLIVITTLFELTNSSLINIYNYGISVINSNASLNRIREICDIEIDDKYNNEDLNINSIKVNNLTFSYNYKDMCLNNINFTVNSNEKIIISGQSGIGKSTIAKILMGYLNIDNNQVYINNKDINTYSKNILKERITYVSQNEILFSLTIKENIIMDRNVSEVKFNEVIRLMKIDDILLKNNLTYDFIIEENGFNLSGGERQRIVLARSILKESDVYIFDESLCNLDVELEREVLINLFKYLKDKIVIVISHRFNNEFLFDKKIIIKKGEE